MLTQGDQSAETASEASNSTQQPQEGTTPSPKRRTFLVILRYALLILLVLPLLQVLLLRFIDPPFTTMMVYQSIERLFSGEPIAWSHDNVAQEDISPYLLRAIVSAEDQRFFQHHGFDLKEIEKAQKQHERRPNKPIRGASTISQQVAKNLFLPPWRNFVRKGIEAYYTLLIELLWPKTRILTMYANIVEFAPRVYGAEAAAQYHFHRSAKSLSANQAALLAAVLPNPRRWSASKPTGYIQRRAARVLRQMQGLPVEEEDE